MLRILVACANGAGTSLMMKMRVEKATKDLGVKVQTIHHCSLSEGKSAATQYDVVFCPLNFVNMFDDAAKKGIVICGMKNVLSDKEAQELLINSGLVEKNK
ncbi:PTS sugar transporter subunit IIB [Anaerorhabdus sp.]|uniref:PTS sugar transporter subunit IIB n=1 Tax=Anaerorhabdus sp. TaxID=1872524 RepID=UPI002B2039E6|nr:PTS sugar transporter subunit IIB [Anaerorhabdus sp.]MEA4876201.1 PTS sugar transporter subunit IIB [Anaerorhabdus sp.]